MNYSDLTALINEIRKSIIQLKESTPNDPQLKVTTLRQINDLLNEQNRLILYRQNILNNRTRHLSNRHKKKNQLLQS